MKIMLLLETLSVACQQHAITLFPPVHVRRRSEGRLAAENGLTSVVHQGHGRFTASIRHARVQRGRGRFTARIPHGTGTLRHTPRAETKDASHCNRPNTKEKAYKETDIDVRVAWKFARILSLCV